MTLTLRDVARQPELLKDTVATHSGPRFVIRPLAADDQEQLVEFLGSLSSAVRGHWVIDDYGYVGAAAMCDAIARYDKLRFVITAESKPTRLEALMEFSFGIPQDDIERYNNYDIALSEKDYCRFGPCVRDDMQRSGLATAAMPFLLSVARRFDRANVILWGGVFADNLPAIAFYAKHGFEEVGRFIEPSTGRESVDMVRPVDNVATDTP